MSKPGRWVNIPGNFGFQNEERTKPVDEQVIPVIFPEHTDLARRPADRIAVEEQEEFDSCNFQK